MDEQFIKTVVEQLMEQDPDLTAGDARYAVNAVIRAKEETTNRADQLALFYELMDGRPYGHAN